PYALDVAIAGDSASSDAESPRKVVDYRRSTVEPAPVVDNIGDKIRGTRKQAGRMRIRDSTIPRNKPRANPRRESNISRRQCGKFLPSSICTSLPTNAASRVPSMK